MNLSLQLIDLRDEISEYERLYRPFPPRSSSVTKSKVSTEPEIDFLHVKFDERGKGKEIFYVYDL